LALLLGAGGNRVALVDADLALANLDLLMDCDVSINLSHVIAGTRKLREIIVDLPGGVQFVPGASGLVKLAHLSDFQRMQLMKELMTLEADNDVLIVDTAAGIGPDVLQIAQAADNVLLVTAPEPPAITDAYAVIKLLAQRRYEGHISLLVNLTPTRREARSTYRRISTVAWEFLGVKVSEAGYVLSDPKVREAVRGREPFVVAYPRCPASRCMAALATKLSAAENLGSGGESFFRRVANWLA
ncbi:unnamed protein product, partial [marine sediment metagenome]